MSNPHFQPGEPGGYEREDLSPRSVYAFLLGLAVLGILAYFAVNGVYWGLERYSGAHQPQQNPMKQRGEADTRDTDTAKVEVEINRTFPEPRLETDERNEITGLRSAQQEQLNSYGWVDQPGGAVHIPIERAMQLVAERGLTVRPESGAVAKAKP